MFNHSLWNIDNIASLVVNIYLGLRPREIFLPRYNIYRYSTQKGGKFICGRTSSYMRKLDRSLLGNENLPSHVVSNVGGVKFLSLSKAW